jgi:hypothetical protein
MSDSCVFQEGSLRTSSQELQTKPFILKRSALFCERENNTLLNVPLIKISEKFLT